MRQRRAQHRAAGACGSQTRDRFDFRLHAFSAQLEDQRCHAVDAAVAGADEAHGFSLARQIERQLAAGDLLRHGRLIERLSGVAVLDQIDIDRIPDDGVAGAKRAVGADVLESLTPAQMIVKIVNEELTALMFERLPEAVRIGLEAIYSDADVVTGVEVTYTVNFSIYGINGTKDTTVYTVKYVVTGKAEFEYVEDSLKAIG